MLAADTPRFGPPEVLEIVDVPVPEPGSGEVLVRVEAVGVNSADARLRAGTFPPGFGLVAPLAVGFRRPRVGVLGICISGTVERVGPAARFAPGDAVAGQTGARMRGHAEFAVAPVKALGAKPDGVSHADAAGVIFGGSAALYFLRDRARLAAGEAVLVNGASGAVGSAAVQIARHLGATVTAVSSERNHGFVTGLGADHVVDYTATPVTSLTERFDVVFDAVGNLSAVTGRRLLTDGGRLVLAVAGIPDMIRGLGRVISGVVPTRGEDVDYLLDLVASGELDPVTTVAGDLSALRDAHRVVDSGRKVGNLVVQPAAGPDRPAASP